ncbi:MAG TPA: hypothetical protein DCS93_25140 [Microscillaceae bacterium]|nr:hypothetical protein [Microscillaceae bacterium]
MKYTLITLAIVLTSVQAFAQKNESPLAVFEVFTTGKWEMNGTWGNGKKFRQTQIFKWGLNKKIMKVQTYGTVNQKTGAFGLRNEGIRAWDAQKKQIVFWEFDVFGGITQGTCTVDGKNIYYDYPYMGKNFRDSWVFVHANKYAYKVGVYENGKWGKVYHESYYQRVQK